jgi:hypothetical protein
LSPTRIGSKSKIRKRRQSREKLKRIGAANKKRGTQGVYFGRQHLDADRLVVCTGLGFLLTSLKLPHYGVIANLIGQVFWVYSSYRAWREADQIGIFISTVIITLILVYGVTNYWLFGETFSVKEH